MGNCRSKPKEHVFVSEHAKHLSEGNLEFALDLLKEITKTKDNSNSFFSPLSITVALSMVNVGARNNTAAELKKALHLDTVGDSKEVDSAFEEILKSLNPKDGKSLPFTLEMANRMYVAKSYELIDQYVVTLTEKYDVKAVPTNFSGQTENEINDWVKKVTRNKIMDLLPNGVLGPLTRLILVNAVYFKGTWYSKFDTNCTQDEPFYRKTDDMIKTEMMHMNTDLNYVAISKHKCKILELPYSGNRLSMLFILPDSVDGLTELESNLTAETFRFLIRSMRMVAVILTLPKFKLEETTLVVPVLRQLGVRDAFLSETADLSGISAQKDLYVSDIFHKAFVEVNEKGTEAAAAAGMYVKEFSLGYSKPLKINEFKADHPFVFAIYDQINQLILFLGRLTNPE